MSINSNNNDHNISFHSDSQRIDLLEKRQEKSDMRLSLAEELLRLKKVQELNQTEAGEERFQIIWNKVNKIENEYSTLNEKVKHEHLNQETKVQAELERLKQILTTDQTNGTKTIKAKLTAIEEELEKNRNYTVKGHHLMVSEIEKITRNSKAVQDTLRITLSNQMAELERRLSICESENNTLRTQLELSENKQEEYKKDIAFMTDSIKKLLKVNEFAQAQKRINLRNERSIELLHEEMKHMKHKIVDVLSVFNSCNQQQIQQQQQHLLDVEDSIHDITITTQGGREVTLKGNDVIQLIDELRMIKDTSSSTPFTARKLNLTTPR